MHPHFPFIYLTISIPGSSIIFGLSLKYTLRFVPSRMKDTRSALYKEFMDKFNLALQNDDMETAHSVYNELKLMLHPDNVLRKVLEIQMIGG